MNIVKRRVIVPTLIFALLFSAVARILIANLAQANPTIVPISDLLLESPQNKNYVQNFVQVRLSYSILDEPVNDHSAMQTSVSYVLDGLESVSVSNYTVSNYRFVSNKLPNSISYLISFQITNLPKGSHTLSVRISATADKGFTTFAASSELVTFTINTYPSSINPTPSLEPAINPSPSPDPSINPYPSPDAQPLPITIAAAASVASVAIISIGLLFYRKRRREAIRG